MILVTILILVGASYIDVSWIHGINTTKVNESLDETIIAQNKGFELIKHPQTKVGCKREAKRFKEELKTTIECTISAIDGITIEMTNQSPQYVSDTLKYMNRKCFFAVVAQGGVTADCLYVFYL